MIPREKRGQAAAAVFVAIIAALLIMFIILVNPQERAALLDEPSPGTTPPVTGVAKNLLKASPGRIDYLAQNEIEHPLPVVNIYTKTETRVLAEKNVAYTKKGLFSEVVDQLTFTVPSVADTENLLLSFDVREIEGRLVVALNGEEVYNDEPSNSVAPISIPKNLLQENNVMTFVTSSPGMAFWRTHEATLDNIKVVADVTSFEAQSSKHVFLVSETEKKNLESVSLRFQPQCVFGKVGKLTITVNGGDIYNAIPDCDLAMIPLEIAPENLLQGENEVVFRTEQGIYYLSHVVIKSKLKTVEFPTFFFELSHENYLSVEEQEQRVVMQVSFVDVVAAKQGEVIVNGHRRHFDTKDVSFTVDISSDVVQGNNAVKIKPGKTLEIREIRVDLKE